MSDILSTPRNRNINCCTDILNITNILVSGNVGLNAARKENDQAECCPSQGSCSIPVRGKRFLSFLNCSDRFCSNLNVCGNFSLGLKLQRHQADINFHFVQMLIISIPILYLFQQIAQAVTNNYVVLAFLLHVSYKRITREVCTKAQKYSKFCQR